MGSPSSTGGSGGGSALQLAMAAFLGASVTAVSAFLFHIHTLNGLIDYVQSLSRRKGLADVQEEEDGEEREAEEGDDDYEEDQDEEEEEVEEEVEEEDADDDRDEEKKEEDDHADDDEEAEEVNGNASVAASDSSLAKLKGDSMEEDVIMLRPSSNGDSSLGSLELNQNALPRLRTGRESEFSVVSS